MTESNKIYDEHDEDWFDNDSVSDQEKVAYLDSLTWEPVKNLAVPANSADNSKS